MHALDLAIFILYMAAMVGVGLVFLRRNAGADDYYVGGRDMGSLHVGLSVVATDVGGGFSIGLGGLGFTIGLSGSWMLFTGLIGAWASAVLLIPRVRSSPAFARAFTFPEVFRQFYGRRVALVAGVISAIGYVGFTSSQILAGAKLASGTLPDVSPEVALVVMGSVAVVYTALGGIKAVIYTDTIQWAVLLLGLSLVGLPVAFVAVGGWEAIRASLPPGHLRLDQVGWAQLVNWGVTIIPIWFIGTTLYQRMFACRDERTARRAWYLAGLLEWPLMALLGVSLGVLARVAAEQGLLASMGVASAAGADPEAALPMMLGALLPVGVMGVVMSAYFSAILSTADSCLMAASGNVVTDVIGHFRPLEERPKTFLRASQGTTLALGVLALVLASLMTSVLDLMLYSYAFMVSGLLVPLLAAIFGDSRSGAAALAAMLVGGAVTIGLGLAFEALPLGLDANVFGIAASALSFAAVAGMERRRGAT